MRESVNVVLFDLDDTLYDESTFVASGFQSVATHLEQHVQIDRRELFDSMMRTLSQKGRGTVFDDILKQYDVYSPERVEELVTVYRTHHPEIRLYPDVLPTFRQLRAVRVRLGLITDGMGSVQRRKIEALNLESMMDVIICTDDIGRAFWKPHPLAFQRALATLGTQPEEAIYVGNDPTKDFGGPRTIGMSSVHLCRQTACSAPSCEATIHSTALEQVVQTITKNIGEVV